MSTIFMKKPKGTKAKIPRTNRRTNRFPSQSKINLSTVFEFKFKRIAIEWNSIESNANTLLPNVMNCHEKHEKSIILSLMEIILFLFSLWEELN